MFDDQPVRKQAFLDDKNINFTVNPCFWAKIRNFVLDCFGTKSA